MFPYTKLDTQQLRKTNTATQSVRIYEPSTHRPVARIGLLFLLLLSLLMGLVFWIKPVYLQKVIVFVMATVGEIQTISASSPSEVEDIQKNILTPVSQMTDSPNASPYLLTHKLTQSNQNQELTFHTASQNINKQTSVTLMANVGQQPHELLDLLREQVQQQQQIQQEQSSKELEPPIQPASQTPLQNNQPDKEAIPHRQNERILPTEEKTIRPNQQTQKIQALLAECEKHFQAHRLTTGKKGTAFECYNQVLAQDANNLAAQQGLKKIQARYQEWTANALTKGHYAKASRYLDRIQVVNPDTQIFQQIDDIFHPLLTKALNQKQFQSASEQLQALKQLNPQSTLLPVFKQRLENTLNSVLQQCKTHLDANRLTTGEQGTAFDCYQQVLTQMPKNSPAQAGLAEIAARYQTWAEKALQRHQLKKAQTYLDRLRMVDPRAKALYTLERRLTRLKQPVAKPNAVVEKPRHSRSTPSQARVKPTKPPTSRSPMRSVTPIKRTTQKPTTPKKSKPQPVKRTTPKPTTPKKSKPQPASPPTRSSSTRPPRCNDILLQESLGIRPLTAEQKRFKQQRCH